MSDFPILNSGAVTQYPIESAMEYRTKVLRFIDGSEQRFRSSGSGAHRWIVRFDLLAEDELRRIQEFFELQRGRDGAFRFIDPRDGREYPNCSFDHDDCRMEQTSEGRAKTVLVIKENPA